VIYWRMDASGSGTPRAIPVHQAQKIALYAGGGPYTSGGRSITVSRFVSRAALHKACSASHLETP
jgi:hypothetical protein